jgi:hypothetical protein
MLTHQCPMQIVNTWRIWKQFHIRFLIPDTCVNADCEYMELANMETVPYSFPDFLIRCLCQIHANHQNTSIVNIELANVETVSYSFPDS